MTHAAPEPTPPAVSSSEPVLVAHAVTVILAALVTLGWVTIPSPLIDGIGTVVALALSGIAVVVARSKVTPVTNVADWESWIAEVVAAEVATWRELQGGG